MTVLTVSQHGTGVWPDCNVVELDKDKKIEISSMNLHPVSKSILKAKEVPRVPCS